MPRIAGAGFFKMTKTAPAFPITGENVKLWEEQQQAIAALWPSAGITGSQKPARKRGSGSLSRVRSGARAFPGPRTGDLVRRVLGAGQPFSCASPVGFRGRETTCKGVLI